MAEVKDILCDEDGEIACVHGDLFIGESTVQHQADLLEANEGEYKQNPTTGIGLRNFLDDEDPREMLRKIRIQFTKDNMEVTKLTFATDLIVKASYR